MTTEPTPDTDARPFTVEEMRDAFLGTLRAYARYWGSLVDQTIDERLDGLAFSFLNMLDGTSMSLPAFDLVPHPHPDDEAFLRDEGLNWWTTEPINGDVMLHELFVKPRAGKGEV